MREPAAAFVLQRKFHLRCISRLAFETAEQATMSVVDNNVRNRQRRFNHCAMYRRLRVEASANGCSAILDRDSRANLYADWGGFFCSTCVADLDGIGACIRSGCLLEDVPAARCAADGGTVLVPLVRATRVGCSDDVEFQSSSRTDRCIGRLAGDRWLWFDGKRHSIACDTPACASNLAEIVAGLIDSQIG